MSETISESDLEAYLDEALPPAQMGQIESALRDDRAFARRLTAVIGRRDAGVHSVGDIWRGGRLSCPDRDQLGSFLLGALSDEADDYIRFHLETVGCRYCGANLEDLQSRQSQTQSEVQGRRQKYFQTSAGLLRGK